MSDGGTVADRNIDRTSLMDFVLETTIDRITIGIITIVRLRTIGQDAGNTAKTSTDLARIRARQVFERDRQFAFSNIPFTLRSVAIEGRWRIKADSK